ncbi:uncharacterized protein [Canis lupus baileyi]|uniref:uncharacterized protein isoform X6 n=1 Tax=Canis lupus baileyi TaxID=143281 RepID=UPI003B97B108
MAGREEPRGGANVPEAEFPKGQRVSGLGGLDSTKGRGRSACRGRLQLTAPSSSGLSQVPAHQPLRHKPGGSGSSHLARTFPTLVWAFRTTKQCEAMVFTGPLRYSPEDWQLENRSKGTTHYGLLASGRGARGCDFSFQTLVLLGKRGEDTPIHPSLRALPLVEVQSPTRDSRFRQPEAGQSHLRTMTVRSSLSLSSPRSSAAESAARGFSTGAPPFSLQKRRMPLTL